MLEAWLRFAGDVPAAIRSAAVVRREIPMRCPAVAVALSCLLLLAGALRAEDADVGHSDETLRSAVGRSLPLLVQGARGSREQRPQCFTCHGQGAAIRAMAAARTRGIPIDEEEFRANVRFVSDFLDRNRSGYLEGRGQGGRALTAGYALWAMEEGEEPPGETTTAVTEYLLQYQRDRDHWEPDMPRPPSEKSFFTASYVALRGLKTFGTPDQQERIRRRTAEVRAWICAAPAEETEDSVFRLRGLQVVSAPPEEIARAARDLVALQRGDGGWRQRPDLESDPYSTGTALVALQSAAAMPAIDPVYRAGLRFLLKAQLGDGSWHVATRSRPIMTHFESGYPHGADQFLSMAAAGWATTALIEALPIPERPPADLVPPPPPLPVRAIRAVDEPD